MVSRRATRTASARATELGVGYPGPCLRNRAATGSWGSVATSRAEKEEVARARAARGAAAAEPEDGGGRTADGRAGARLQQPANRDRRQPGAAGNPHRPGPHAGTGTLHRRRAGGMRRGPRRSPIDCSPSRGARRSTPKPVESNQLVVGMSDMIRRTAGPSVEFRVAEAPSLWITRCDPNQLENALLNLCIKRPRRDAGRRHPDRRDRQCRHPPPGSPACGTCRRASTSRCP